MEIETNPGTPAPGLGMNMDPTLMAWVVGIFIVLAVIALAAVTARRRGNQAPSDRAVRGQQVVQNRRLDSGGSVRNTNDPGFR